MHFGRQTELVRVGEVDPRIVVDLRYARAENFTGRILYRSAEAWLRPRTALKLRQAQDLLAARRYSLVVLDAYRPPSAQAAMWATLADERYVAPPSRGSRHTRGASVDVTLRDADGVELDMPSLHDEFTEKAHRDYPGSTSLERENCRCLTEAMTASGFLTLRTEWWHFDDADWRDLPLLTWEFDHAMDPEGRNELRPALDCQGTPR